VAKSPTTTPDEPLVLSVEACARVTGLGRTKLYEALATGELPSLKIGRRRLIRVATLEAWLASLERQAG